VKGDNFIFCYIISLIFCFLQETAAREGVSAMPTFIFYRNKMKIDTMRGADPNALEEKIKQWKGGDEDSQDDDVIVKGHVRL
jgi:hypothetical protein